MGTWENEIMPTRCWRLCRHTLGAGRTGRSRRAWQTRQQSQVDRIMTGLSMTGIVLLNSVRLPSSATSQWLRVQPHRECALFSADCMAIVALKFRVQSAESCIADSRSNRDQQSSVAGCRVLYQSSIIN